MTVETQDQRAPRLKRLHEALESGTVRRVRRELNSLHPAEIADLLESLPPAQREVVWELVDPDASPAQAAYAGGAPVDLHDVLIKIEEADIAKAAIVFEADDGSGNGTSALTRSDAGGDWVADGYTIGDWIRVSNLPDDAEDGLFKITNVLTTVLTLEAEEGRLFKPLAYTKTYAMAASAGLAVTLVPVLMGYFIRGRIPREQANPLSRLLIRLYKPLLRAVLAAPRLTLLIALLVILSTLLPAYGVSGLIEPLRWPLLLLRDVAPETGGAAVKRVEQWQSDMHAGWQEAFGEFPLLGKLGRGVGAEFMPELFEGDLMYMPTTLPGLSIGKAQELLQQTDRRIRQLPEVQRVFGKIGRADTATDPAPLTMIETLIQLKPREQWRIGTEHEKFGYFRDTLAPLPYDGPRSIKAVLEGLQQKFGWQPVKAPSGRGQGVALGIDAGTYVGLAAQVEVDRATGKVEISESARISGKVTGEAIAVAEGAVVEGQMKTTGRTEPVGFVEKRQTDD